MGDEFEVFENDEDALIEYDPGEDIKSAPPENVNFTSSSQAAFRRALRFWPLIQNQTIATKNIYVCSICLRQYDLAEDLRGHMIYFHSYKAIVSKNLQNAESQEAPAQNPEDNIIAPLDDNKQDAEIKPMSFRDFRLLLRAKMNIRCTASSSCKFTFENNEKLEQHVKCHIESKQNNNNNNNKSTSIFGCTLCKFKVKSWRQCSAHLLKEHAIDVDHLVCPICDFKANGSVLVWRHMRIHAAWRALVTRTMRREQKRKLKMAAQNNDNNKNGKNAQTNLPVVNKNKYYAEKVCNICERKFVNGKTLSKHVKTVHNKVKPFKCNVCGMQTSRKASLEIHMRQHTGEKPLKCKECKFATRDPSVLHKHQLRHKKTVEGKFQCPACSYICIQTNIYKRHLRIHHPEDYKKIACHLCSFATITTDKLKQHLEDHRKGLIVDTDDSLDALLLEKSKRRKLHDKNDSVDCFLPLESIDSMPHEPALDTGGFTIPAPPSEDTQFPTF